MNIDNWMCWLGIAWLIVIIIASLTGDKKSDKEEHEQDIEKESPVPIAETPKRSKLIPHLVRGSLYVDRSSGTYLLFTKHYVFGDDSLKNCVKHANKNVLISGVNKVYYAKFSSSNVYSINIIDIYDCDEFLKDFDRFSLVTPEDMEHLKDLLIKLQDTQDKAYIESVYKLHSELTAKTKQLECTPPRTIESVNDFYEFCKYAKTKVTVSPSIINCLIVDYKLSRGSYNE